MTTFSMLISHLFLLICILIGVGNTSLSYYVFLYEITSEEYDQFLRELTFPMNLLRKLVIINYSDQSKLLYSRILRIATTLIFVFAVIRSVAIWFRNETL